MAQRSANRLYPASQGPPFVPAAVAVPDFFEARFPDRVDRARSRHAVLAAGPFEPAALAELVALAAQFETATVAPAYIRRRIRWRQDEIAQVDADPESFVPRGWTAVAPEWFARRRRRHDRGTEVVFVEPPAAVAVYYADEYPAAIRRRRSRAHLPAYGEAVPVVAAPPAPAGAIARLITPIASPGRLLVR